MRTAVDALILQEMARMEGEGGFRVADYIAPATGLQGAPDLASASALVRAEMGRLARGEGAGPRLDVSRYSSVTAPSGAAAGDVGAWEASVSAASLALEAQALRGINLELMAAYGEALWKAGAGEVDAQLAAQRRHVAALTAAAEGVNGARKAPAEAAAGRLKALARKYEESVGMNLATELACADAEVEVKRLRRAVADGGGGGGGGAGGT
jgi:hypothetical protein